MSWFLLCIYLIYMVLIFLSRKEKIDTKQSLIDGLFEKMAKWLSKRPLLKDLRLPKVKENLNMLHPAKDVQVILEDFYIKKIKMVLVLLFAGNVVVTICKGYTVMNPEIFSECFIERNEKGQGEKVVEATAYLSKDEEVKRESIVVVVSEQAYTEEEIESFFSEIKESMEQNMLSENESLDKVTTSLNLPTSYSGNPLKIEWSSSDYGLIDENGRVYNEELQSPVSVILTAKIQYEKKIEEFEIPIILYPREYTQEEAIKLDLEKSIEEGDKNGIEKKYMELPQNINGYEVYYVEKSQATESLLWIIFLIVGILSYINEDQKVDAQVEKKKKALILEYPEFVSKLTLLVHAGMTVKGAIARILQNYEEQKEKKINYCYEELRIALYEMENGVFEEKAYENLGKRMKLSPYIKLSGLLSQNVKKGSKDLLLLLENEAKEAFEERKSMARRLGEEAGTKLLLPMMLMLLVVIILIMIPAFLSYQF